MRIKKGDNVIVLAGNDKGKTGEVIKVMPKDNKVVVKGVNVRKKHIKPRSQGQEGGIVEMEMPIYVSKVMLIDPETKKPTRVGYEIVKGEKVRISKKSGAKIK